MWSRFLTLTLASSFLLACQSSPLSMEPINTQATTQLPALNAAAETDLRLFSFRVITPIKNIDVFSVLQAAQVAADVNTTLPVGQLKEVQIAKEKILSSEFLNPALATTLAFEVSRQYSWDREIARQILVEIIGTYAQHRDRELKKYRDQLELKAQYLIGQNKIRQQELAERAEATRDRGFADKPLPQARTTEEQNKQRESFEAYIQNRITRNNAAQIEYNKQAKAAVEEYKRKLDETTQRARKKEEQAQAIRKAQFEAILDRQKNGFLPDFTTMSADSSAQSPYQLLTLANGDFMLEAREALPAVIHLKVNEFDLPITIPVMPQTMQGRLLVSIDKDAQGRPLVYGGMDADSGGRFDMNSPLFTLSYSDANNQQLEFFYPDGRLEQFNVQALTELTADNALQVLPGQNNQLDAIQLQARQTTFSQLRYQITPEIDFIQPDEALAIVQDVQASL